MCAQPVFHVSRLSVAACNTVAVCNMQQYATHLQLADELQNVNIACGTVPRLPGSIYYIGSCNEFNKNFLNQIDHQHENEW